MNNLFNLTPKERLIRARVMLNRNHPFFARLTMLMKFQVDNSISTMGVDVEGKCYYNEEFVSSLTDEQLMGTLCHEVMHCALKHLIRGDKLKHEIYNISADLIINDMIKENSMELPTDGLIPYNHEFTLKLPDGNDLKIKDINKRGAESIYNEIRNAWKDNNNSQSGGQGKGQEGFDKHIYGKGSGDADLQGRDQDFWDNKIVESAMASKMAGKLPAGMERIIKDITNPQMKWQHLLQKFIRKNLPYDFTWRRPSKKTYSTKIYLPQVDKQGMNVVFLIDTSGSMSAKDLSQCFSEINGVVRSIRGISLHVLYHDTKVYEGSKLMNPTERDIILELSKCKGGGGTDFETAYKYIEDNIRDVDVVIHLTDGYDTFPKEFKKPLIVCLQLNGKGVEETKKECSYATVVKVTKE